MRHQASFTLRSGKLWLVRFGCAWPLARWARGTHSSPPWGNFLAALCLFAWPNSGSCKFYARSPPFRWINHQYLILAREVCLHFWHLEVLHWFRYFPLSLPLFYSDYLIWSATGFIFRLRRVPSHLRNWARFRVDLNRYVFGIQAVEASPWRVLFFLRLKCWLYFHLELNRAAGAAQKWSKLEVVPRAMQRVSWVSSVSWAARCNLSKTASGRAI